MNLRAWPAALARYPAFVRPRWRRRQSPRRPRRQDKPVEIAAAFPIYDSVVDPATAAIRAALVDAGRQAPSSRSATPPALPSSTPSRATQPTWTVDGHLTATGRRRSSRASSRPISRRPRPAPTSARRQRRHGIGRSGEPRSRRDAEVMLSLALVHLRARGPFRPPRPGRHQCKFRLQAPPARPGRGADRRCRPPPIRRRRSTPTTRSTSSSRRCATSSRRSAPPRRSARRWCPPARC